ncbi:TerB family tellurite resistance protein [Robiginitalea sp.]|uniref:TerB family tellurite resistance protein n=1 Tax=Robiginitalea sp. TaxID=1902411 RepID=UPI003C734C6F
MELNIIEKLAVIKAVDEVIRMDDMLDVGELDYLTQLAEVLDFDVDLLLQARDVEAVEAIAVIRVMSESKKAFLMRSMTEAANADGVVDEAEIQFIYRVLAAAGISSGD